DLADRVVRRGAFRINTIDDIELQHHVGTVFQNATDAPEVFIAHDNGRDHFVNVKRPVVEGTNLTELTSRIINANYRIILFKERIELLVNLAIRQRFRRVRCRRRSWRWRRKREWSCVWSITFRGLFVRQPLRW